MLFSVLIIFLLKISLFLVPLHFFAEIGSCCLSSLLMNVSLDWSILQGCQQLSSSVEIYTTIYNIFDNLDILLGHISKNLNILPQVWQKFVFSPDKCFSWLVHFARMSTTIFNSTDLYKHVQYLCQQLSSSVQIYPTITYNIFYNFEIPLGHFLEIIMFCIKSVSKYLNILNFSSFHIPWTEERKLIALLHK